MEVNDAKKETSKLQPKLRLFKGKFAPSRGGANRTGSASDRRRLDNTSATVITGPKKLLGAHVARLNIEDAKNFPKSQEEGRGFDVKDGSKSLKHVSDLTSFDSSCHVQSSADVPVPEAFVDKGGGDLSRKKATNASEGKQTLSEMTKAAKSPLPSGHKSPGSGLALLALKGRRYKPNVKEAAKARLRHLSGAAGYELDEDIYNKQQAAKSSREMKVGSGVQPLKASNKESKRIVIPGAPTSCGGGDTPTPATPSPQVASSANALVPVTSGGDAGRVPPALPPPEPRLDSAAGRLAEHADSETQPRHVVAARDGDRSIPGTVQATAAAMAITTPSTEKTSILNVLVKKPRNRNHKRVSAPKPIAEMQLRDFIYYNPRSNPMPAKTNEEQVVTTATTVKQVDESEDKSSNVIGPKVMLGANDEVILDPKSLYVDNSTAGEQAPDTNMSTVGMKRRYGAVAGYRMSWSKPEIVHFYLALNKYGSDLGYVATLLDRPRPVIVRKWKNEEKVRGDLLDKACMGNLSDEDIIEHFGEDNLIEGKLYADGKKPSETKVKAVDQKPPEKKKRMRTNKSSDEKRSTKGRGAGVEQQRIMLTINEDGMPVLMQKVGRLPPQQLAERRGGDESDGRWFERLNRMSHHVRIKREDDHSEVALRPAVAATAIASSGGEAAVDMASSGATAVQTFYIPTATGNQRTTYQMMPSTSASTTSTASPASSITVNVRGQYTPAHTHTGNKLVWPGSSSSSNSRVAASLAQTTGPPSAVAKDAALAIVASSQSRPVATNNSPPCNAPLVKRPSSPLRTILSQPPFNSHGPLQKQPLSKMAAIPRVTTPQPPVLTTSRPAGESAVSISDTSRSQIIVPRPSLPPIQVESGGRSWTCQQQPATVPVSATTATTTVALRTYSRGRPTILTTQPPPYTPNQIPHVAATGWKQPLGTTSQLTQTQPPTASTTTPITVTKSQTLSTISRCSVTVSQTIPTNSSHAVTISPTTSHAETISPFSSPNNASLPATVSSNASSKHTSSKSITSVATRSGNSKLAASLSRKRGTKRPCTLLGQSLKIRQKQMEKLRAATQKMKLIAAIKNKRMAAAAVDGHKRDTNEDLGLGASEVVCDSGAASASSVIDISEEDAFVPEIVQRRRTKYDEIAD